MEFVSHKKKIFIIKIVALCVCLAVAVISGFISWGYKSGAFYVAKMTVSNKINEKLESFGLVLKSVPIMGNIRTSVKQIDRTLNFRKGMPIFEIDLEKIKKDLEQLPWVKKAKVSRILPSTIAIEVFEKTPIAIWQDENRKYIPIDENGELIHTGIKGLNDFIILTGDNSPKLAPDLIRTLSSYKDIKQRTKAAVRIGNRRWDIILDDIKDGLTINLPENDAEDALKKLVNINEKHKIINDKTKLIDLRIKDRIRIRFKENSNEVLWTA